ncbi:hypothetical protein ACWCQL_23625 [Streptomyces sp. NPDC002073]
MARPIVLALDGRVPLVLARAAGLTTFGSSPLHGGELPDLLTPELAEFVRPGASPAAACLLAAASCPSLDVVLLSAGIPARWEAAKDAIAPPRSTGRLRKVTDVLTGFGGRSSQRGRLFMPQSQCIGGTQTSSLTAF